jgi:hypothetical protein
MSYESRYLQQEAFFVILYRYVMLKLGGLQC